MRRALLALVFLLSSSSAFAQQDYVPRYELYTGFAYLNSPALNLAERGFNGEFGVNLNRWFTLGGDFSVFTGHSDITPQELTPALQQQLVRVIPPGVAVSLPFDSTTYTFAAGPQFSLRKFKWVTLFARPGFGGLHETATLKPNTPLTTALVAQLVPSGKKSDLEPFFGAGGGFEVNASKHVGMYVALDYVYVKLFDGFLANGRNSLRVSVGPTFRFGPNVK